MNLERRLKISIGLAALAWLGGCATKPSQRAETRSSISGSTSLVFAPLTPGVIDADAGLILEEAFRRDAALSVRQDGPLLATDAWPEPLRPDLLRSRHVRAFDRVDSTNTIFYFPYSRYEHGHHGYVHRATWWNSR